MTERIMVVDDSEDNRKLISAILGRAGYEIVEASSGTEALRKALETRLDLILLDIIMPGPDGFCTCAELKNNPLTSDVPVIFLSARTRPLDKVKGFEAGGADYVTKPFDGREILARVHSHLQIRKLTRELLLANHELTLRQRHIEEDLNAAAGIQRHLLPRTLPSVAGVEVAWEFMPSEIIGGDIFNVVKLDDSHLGIYMVDVSGHGVPSALVTVSVSQTLQPQAGMVIKNKVAGHGDITPPGEIVKALDAEYPVERFDKYFTMVYMVMRLETGAVKYCNAGHTPPVLLRCGGGLDLLETGGPVIGLNGAVPFEEEEISVRPGDKIVLYTDGVIEHENRSGDFFGDERLYGLLDRDRVLPIGKLLGRVVGELAAFGDIAHIRDDISLLGLEFRQQDEKRRLKCGLKTKK